jgi:hypothetical protein
MSGSRGNAAGAGGGAVYGLGFIGALVYHIQSATSFSDGGRGVLQAIVRAAFLVCGVSGPLKLRPSSRVRTTLSGYA